MSGVLPGDILIIAPAPGTFTPWAEAATALATASANYRTAIQQGDEILETTPDSPETKLMKLEHERIGPVLKAHATFLAQLSLVAADMAVKQAKS